MLKIIKEPNPKPEIIQVIKLDNQESPCDFVGWIEYDEDILKIQGYLFGNILMIARSEFTENIEKNDLEWFLKTSLGNNIEDEINSWVESYVDLEILDKPKITKVWTYTKLRYTNSLGQDVHWKIKLMGKEFDLIKWDFELYIKGEEGWEKDKNYWSEICLRKYQSILKKQSEESTNL